MVPIMTVAPGSTVSDGCGPAVDPARFRVVLGHFPTSVVVVSAALKGRPVGLVVGSFVSISLDPPLVGVFVALTSASWPSIQAAGGFTVNVLSEVQGALCGRFARSGGDKFAGLTWTTSVLGHPVLAGCQAYLDCRIERAEVIGDHRFVVARVVSLTAHEDRTPLVFFKGALERLDRGGSAAASSQL